MYMEMQRSNNTQERILKMYKVLMIKKKKEW